MSESTKNDTNKTSKDIAPVSLLLHCRAVFKTLSNISDAVILQNYRVLAIN